MEITEVRTGQNETVEIREAQVADIKKLSVKRYHFHWKEDAQVAKVFVLNIVGEIDILGAISIRSIPHEFRIEIKHLASSKENVGELKIYEGIAGCLMAYVCRESVTLFGDDACVSLIPKTKLKAHYIRKYRMIDAGWQIFLDRSA